MYESFAETLTLNCVSTEAPLEGENVHQSTGAPEMDASQFPVALIATVADPPEDGNTRPTLVSEDQLTSTDALPEDPVSGKVRSGSIGVQAKANASKRNAEENRWIERVISQFGKNDYFVLISKTSSPPARSSSSVMVGSVTSVPL